MSRFVTTKDGSGSGGSGGGKFNFRSRFAPQTPAFKRSQKIMNDFRH